MNTGSNKKRARQATLIYNPLAGPADLMGPTALIADAWRGRGWQVDVQPTQAAGHATELARRAAEQGHRLVLAMGGDGTLGEAANGLVNSATALAPLPTGTANSFARELGLSPQGLTGINRLLEADNALANGRVQKMDMGYVKTKGANGRYWFLWTGVGADGFLVSKVEPRSKFLRRFGRAGYAAKSLPALFQLPQTEAKVEIDGRLFEGQYLQILISNCRRYGGILELSPQAALDDGRFEVWLFSGKGARAVARYFALAKLERQHNRRDMLMVHGRSITIHTAAPAPCQIEGDYSGSTPIHCEIKPGALRLLTPHSAPAGLFTQPGQAL